MNEHLPECPTDWCICSYLRACEQRVIDAAVKRVEALLFPWPNTWPGMIRRGDVIIAIKGEL